MEVFICNITQEPQEVTCACGFIGMYTALKYHQVLSKVISINGQSSFDQLATAFSLNETTVMVYFRATVEQLKKNILMS